MNWIKFNSFVMIFISLVLAGCTSSTPYKEIFESDAPTLQSQYGKTQNKSYVGFSMGELDNFTRDSSNEIDNLFPELPNPRLTLYVFPHLNSQGAPIPGYTTAFYLYDHRRIFALPGELQ